MQSLKDQHLNCALAPDLQFDTLELRNALGAAWPESHHSYVQVVRGIEQAEANVKKLPGWRAQTGRISVRIGSQMQ